MIQRQLSGYRQISAGVSVMPHIAHPDDNGLQPEHGDDWLDRRFDVALGQRAPTGSARAPHKGSWRSGK